MTDPDDTPETSAQEFAKTIELVEAAQKGDKNALESLFERYLPRTRRIVAMRMGWKLTQMDDYDDLVQESLLRVFKRLEQFEAKTEGSFRHWVSSCVESAVRDEMRHKTRKKRGGGAVRRFSDFGSEGLASSIFADDDAQTASVIMAGGEAETKVEEALLQLPDRHREVIVLRTFCEMSHDEIAATLNLGQAAAARKAYSRALQKLRDLLSA